MTMKKQAVSNANPPRQMLTKDRDGIYQGLKHIGYSVRFNTRLAFLEITKNEIGPGEWNKLGKHEKHFLIEEFARQFSMYKEGSSIERLREARVSEENKKPFRMTKERWESALGNCPSEVDPVKEFMYACGVWDGQKRLGDVLNKVFVVDDPACPLVEWVGKFLFHGPVLRTFEPGAKLDETPVLIGEQGCLKSTFLSIIGGEWFADQVDLNCRDEKQFVEKTRGVLLGEISEMTGRTKVDLNRMKGLLSATKSSNVRKAYGEIPETVLRTGILVGTCNETDALPNDSTGNRRFVAIQIKSIRPDGLQWLKDNLNQLWAEAMDLYDSHEPAHLPENLKHVQSMVNESHRVTHPFEEMLSEKYLVKLSKGETFRLEEAAEGIELCGGITGVKYASTSRNIKYLRYCLLSLNCEPLPMARYGTKIRIIKWIYNG